MKICPVCNENFEIIRGHGGHNRIYCFECLPFGLSKTERTIIGQQLAYERVSNYKLEMGCAICGYRRCGRALEFHHIDPNSKLGDPSNIAKRSFSRFLEEASKCVCICANCHREQQDGLINIS